MVIGGYDGILFQITQIITFVSCHKVKSMQKCISFWIKLEFNPFTFFCHVVLAFSIFEFDGKFRENLLVAEYMFFYAVLTDLARQERHLEMLYKAAR